MDKKRDLRRLKHAELTTFREQAVRQVQSGISVGAVRKGMGVSRSALFGWLARYRNGGWDALGAGKRGGRKPKLDGDKLQWIYATVVERSWTAEASLCLVDDRAGGGSNSETLWDQVEPVERHACAPTAWLVSPEAIATGVSTG